MGTETFRIVESELLDNAPGIKWQGNGCQLEVWFGDLFDLKGNVLSVRSDKINWDILLPQENSRTYFTRLSPNGLWLAYNIGHGGDVQIDMDTEAEFNDIGIISQESPDNPIFVTDSGVVGDFTWSPDSRWLAYTDEDDRGIKQLYRFSPSNGTKKQLTFRNETLRTGHQVWSPDGRFIATSIRKGEIENERGGVEIIDLRNRSRVEVMPDTEVFSGVRSRQIWWSPESKTVVFSGRGYQDRYSQIYWVDAESGEIIDSFMNNEVPWGTNFSVYSIGGVDELLVENGRREFYLFDRTERTMTLLPLKPPDSYLRQDHEEAPFDFPGEENCDYP